jgi:GH24 family phage-related lysozyme (muramidase)
MLFLQRTAGNRLARQAAEPIGPEFAAAAQGALEDFQAAQHDTAPPPDAAPAPAPAAAQAFDRARAHGLISNYERPMRHVYIDTEGHPTIGIGLNLDRPDSRARLAGVGADYDALRAGQADLTDDQMNQLFDQDLDAAIAGARGLVPTFDQLTPARQFVLADMTFNMGAARLGGFHRMLQQIAAENWAAAADEMRASIWHGQVGQRATDDERRMSTGDW